MPERIGCYPKLFTTDLREIFVLLSADFTPPDECSFTETIPIMRELFGKYIRFNSIFLIADNKVHSNFAFNFGMDSV